MSRSIPPPPPPHPPSLPPHISFASSVFILFFLLWKYKAEKIRKGDGHGRFESRSLGKDYNWCCCCCWWWWYSCWCSVAHTTVDDKLFSFSYGIGGAFTASSAACAVVVVVVVVVVPATTTTTTTTSSSISAISSSSSSGSSSSAIGASSAPAAGTAAQWRPHR